jgi:hypothetical protein
MSLSAIAKFAKLIGGAFRPERPDNQPFAKCELSLHNKLIL